MCVFLKRSSLLLCVKLTPLQRISTQPVPSIQWAWCELENKQQTPCITSYISVLPWRSPLVGSKLTVSWLFTLGERTGYRVPVCGLQEHLGPKDQWHLPLSARHGFCIRALNGATDCTKVRSTPIVLHVLCVHALNGTEDLVGYNCAAVNTVSGIWRSGCDHERRRNYLPRMAQKVTTREETTEICKKLSCS